MIRELGVVLCCGVEGGFGIGDGVLSSERDGCLFGLLWFALAFRALCRGRRFSRWLFRYRYFSFFLCAAQVIVSACIHLESCNPAFALSLVSLSLLPEIFPSRRRVEERIKGLLGGNGISQCALVSWWNAACGKSDRFRYRVQGIVALSPTLS